ncbi:GW dipeptide domain-containing protein [Apilactobacillus apisilvae]|uniref:GW dipeptide domain-containing protein n=1 Tax=Apilactobacillus apisilvae TaxID=2923364 RepID=A0ABY4PGT3_9LACO|nr:GW dipeptide domain-containing protein [Apilactobacillus apisilvae]UQS84944.1 GW dipeptide domain-containing protein [Apilactobacillus apisilvae]
MKINFKKSLYLGMAALSFATIAGVSTNASSANASTKHTVKSTPAFTTTKWALDQSLTYQATGSAGIYSRPAGVAGAQQVASADSISGKQFMAYQEATTQSGAKYYKVVSFDRNIRGYIAADGINQVNTLMQADKPANVQGYIHTNFMFRDAYASRFSARFRIMENNKYDYRGDPFTVIDAMQVVNGNKYYWVTDNFHSNINGWVNAKYFTNQPVTSYQKLAISQRLHAENK